MLNSETRTGTPVVSIPSPKYVQILFNSYLSINCFHIATYPYSSAFNGALSVPGPFLRFLRGADVAK